MDTFTVEDVPPQSVGGRPLLLTCYTCNSSSGHTLDWHWAHFWKVEGFAVVGLPEPVTVNFVYEDLETVAELSTENGAFVLRLIKKASNPEFLKETERLFGEAIEKAGQPGPMKVNFHKSTFEGYLVGMAIGGYRMIPIWTPSGARFLTPPLATPVCQGSFDTNNNILGIAARSESSKTPPTSDASTSASVDGLCSCHTPANLCSIGPTSSPANASNSRAPPITGQRIQRLESIGQLGQSAKRARKTHLGQKATPTTIAALAGNNIRDIVGAGFGQVRPPFKSASPLRFRPRALKSFGVLVLVGTKQVQ